MARGPRCPMVRCLTNIGRPSAQLRIDRILSTAFGGLIDSGVAVAWLHKAAAFAKRSFLGRAWITVSTFEMTSPEAQENPLAPHLSKRWRKADRRQSRTAWEWAREDRGQNPFKQKQINSSKIACIWLDFIFPNRDLSIAYGQEKQRNRAMSQALRKTSQAGPVAFSSPSRAGSGTGDSAEEGKDSAEFVFAKQLSQILLSGSGRRSAPSPGCREGLAEAIVQEGDRVRTLYVIASFVARWGERAAALKRRSRRHRLDRSRRGRPALADDAGAWRDPGERGADLKARVR